MRFYFIFILYFKDCFATTLVSIKYILFIFKLEKAEIAPPYPI